MAVIVVLAALTLIFFVIRKHTGPAHLAMIAGLSVYEMFGVQLVNAIVPAVGLEQELIKHAVYVALVAAFPLLLYLRSSHGGMHGLLRVIEAAMFAAIMTSLLAEPLAYFIPFDNLSSDIANFIKSIEGSIVAVSVAAAYLDILFLRRDRR